MPTHSGWCACLVVLLFYSALAFAGNEPLPEAELLEFLGRFETSNGKAIDPLLLADRQTMQKEHTTTATTTKDDGRSSNNRKKQRKDGRYEQ